jgi:predicted ATP-dependent serine protease
MGPWLDSLLPSGIRRGDVVLVYGETGVGATTLALTIAAYAAGYGEVVWYSARGCERRQQLIEHMKRLNAWHENQWIADEVDLDGLVDDLRVKRPVFAVVDRLQDLVNWRGRDVPAAYEAIAETAAQTGTAVWINSAIDERGTPWGSWYIRFPLATVASPSRGAHFKLTRLKPGRLDPNPLVVGG